jgi:hypothetical protein
MANRIIPTPADGLTDVDALAIAEVLVATGRAIPIDEWVEEIRIRQGLDTFKMVM